MRGMKNSMRPGMKTRDINLSIFMESLGGTLIGLVVGFILSMILSLAVKSDRVPVNSDPVDIHAITDGSSISGNFFLGGGTIKDVQYYYFYMSTEKGGFKQQKADVNTTTIFEHEDYINTGHLIVQNLILPDDHWARGWAVFDGSGNCGCTQKGSIIGPADLYEFHIPKGSIKHNFNLDLE